MLFGSPLRAAISRSGSASPEVRKADSSCDEWTTDLTRYGSRTGGLELMMCCRPPVAQKAVREPIIAQRFATRNKITLRRSPKYAYLNRFHTQFFGLFLEGYANLMEL